VDHSRYDALMEVVKYRTTVRAFDAAHLMREAQIDEWVATTRHKVMYKDEKNVD
jgi:hypothetical protein